jgi:hypothetical protein
VERERRGGRAYEVERTSLMIAVWWRDDGTVMFLIQCLRIVMPI